jgi:hypothetical protein
MAHEHMAGRAMITADANHSAHLRLLANVFHLISKEIRYVCLSSRSRVRARLAPSLYSGYIAHLIRPVPNS